MTYRLESDPPPLSPSEIAASFRLFGWIGFWSQLALASIPVGILVFAALFNPNRQRLGTAWLGVFLSYSALAVLVFTIYWCFRYTRLGLDLEDPDYRPSRANIIRDLWIGLIANTGGMACTVLLAMQGVGHLLFRTLSVPQNSAVMAPSQGGTLLTRGVAITPLEMISLQAMVNTIAAELVGISVTLWLLSRVSRR